MNYHAYLILQSGNINLNNNNDPDMLEEIITCILCSNDKYLENYLEDGYIPSEHHLNEIMDFYSTRKEGSYNLSIYNYFNQCARRIKLQKNQIKNTIWKTTAMMLWFFVVIQKNVKFLWFSFITFVRIMDFNYFNIINFFYDQRTRT